MSDLYPIYLLILSLQNGFVVMKQTFQNVDAISCNVCEQLCNVSLTNFACWHENCLDCNNEIHTVETYPLLLLGL